MPDPVPPEDVQLSVIVPLARGETEAGGLFEQLACLPAGCEIIVVKAQHGSELRPSSWPGRLAWREYTNAGGRARRLNLGGRIARGRWLWFLHADSRLLPSTLPALQRFLREHHDAFGWFDLHFRRDGPRLTRLNALAANLRSRWWALPFGDQGFVMPRSRFAELGGFDETVECGEDHFFVWKARAAKLVPQRIGAPLATSARKYAEQGWLRVTLRHGRLTLAQAGAARRRLRQAR